MNKGDGLRRLCDAMGVGLDEVVAFGTTDDDMPLLEAAACGFAMKNARAVLKAVANRQAEKSNEDDGVVFALKKLQREGVLPQFEEEEGEEPGGGGGGRWGLPRWRRA